MFTLNCRGRLLTVDKPLIMAIINLTPDSFYENSRVQSGESLLKKAERFIREGAGIIDIGGQSTRPGSEPVSAEEELNRVVPAIESIRSLDPGMIISVDTYYARVAEAAVQAGASMINDVSGGADEAMFGTVAALQVPYILMHMPGTLSNMHTKPVYNEFLKDILDYFIRKTGELNRAGVKDIILDPGFGFGKSAGENFELIKNLPVFSILQKPLLLGVSRKSAIYKTLGVTADEALNGTTVLHTAGLMNGAHILRVHDVKEARETILLTDAIKKGAS